MDAGCGWGSLSIGIADLAARVHAIDTRLERLQFVRGWASALRLDNIHVALADQPHLPFADGYFDTVIASTVADEAGAVARIHPTTQVHPRALLGFARLLKPGGELLLLVENRFGLVRPFRPDTHSRRGLRRRLLRSGYRQVRFLASIRDCRLPRAVTDLDSLSAWETFVHAWVPTTGRSPLRRTASWAWRNTVQRAPRLARLILRDTMPASCVVATK